MGGMQSRDKNNPCEKDVKRLREKVKLLEKEINEVTWMRESERQAYEQEMMVYAFKEGEWRRKRKRLKEEVKKLSKRLEKREERIRGMEDERVMREKLREKEQWEWQLLGAGYLVEQMREERARRDETVEKWKRLYLLIKIELDDLIQRTHQGKRLSWREEEEDLDELQRELKAKEETIILLQARVASMEQEGSKKEREVDILRQSLKIMTQRKKPTRITNCLSRNLHL